MESAAETANYNGQNHLAQNPQQQPIVQAILIPRRSISPPRVLRLLSAFLFTSSSVRSLGRGFPPRDSTASNSCTSCEERLVPTGIT